MSSRQVGSKPILYGYIVIKCVVLENMYIANTWVVRGYDTLTFIKLITVYKD